MTNEDDALLEYGTRVDVRQRFDGRWVHGFIVENANADGYLVRREYDNTILPERFVADDVRHEKRKRNMWWA